MKQEFANYVKDHIREYLPLDFREAEISLIDVVKTNDRMFTGLTIRDTGERAATTIYLEPFAEQAAAGRPMEDILRQIAETGTAYRGHVPVDIAELTDYEAVRPRLTVRLCDPDANREYLKDKPHTPCGELAAYYRIRVEAGEDMNASAAVTDRQMEAWGITKDQLHEDAVRADSERSPVCLYDMVDMLDGGMFSRQPENLFLRDEPVNQGIIPLYVLTNQEKDGGAGVLARDGVLEKLGALIGSDFYLIPSSVHELLLVPDNGTVQVQELESMVRDVNAAQVAPEDLLSDKVQHYDRAAKTLGRKQEKGLLQRLAENKAQLKEQAEKTPKAKTAAKQEPSL